MALPNPLPDNPLRWDGWKNYNSPNFYDRLCLDFDGNASTEQIEDNCRQLLVWWQKKLPLKNQPSNPLAQMLRGGLDEAPSLLAEARTELLDPETRARIDGELKVRITAAAVEELKKIVQFAFVDQELSESAEKRLYETGRGLALTDGDIKGAIDSELERLGYKRAANPPPAPLAPAVSVGASRPDFSGDAFGEFRRFLRMSRLALDGEEMTDDQRDAMCNVGESLGLTGGQAEDLIDEYLEEASGLPPTPVSLSPIQTARPNVSSPSVPPSARAPQVINTTPLARAREKEQNPNFINKNGCEMFFVPSGIVTLGSTGRDATPHEQPITRATVSCFFMARFPITNAQYEVFDPEHRSKRTATANDFHPVVYVSSRQAEKFCQWFSAREGRKYRLPTEAEWEYAARGTDGRTFPWGERLDAGHYANFADVNTSFPWRDTNINDGYAETAPVGSYPRGASPFGIEEMAGNVFEWCLDFYEAYRGKDIVNRRGPQSGSQRIYRGGSWRSKGTSLRVAARAFNLPDYSSSDVGFRVVCEVE